MIITLRHGDSFERLKEIPEDSLGGVITDPPYLISFMGKGWDAVKAGQAMHEWHIGWLRECFRALRPGGVCKVFSATRTYHRVALAMQQAGFEIQGLEAWAYGSGFPKSLNVSSDIDRVLGAVREKVRVPSSEVRNPKSLNGGIGIEGGDRPWIQEALAKGYHEKDGNEAVTDEAKRFEGYGTALKPAWEPFIVGRKPTLEFMPSGGMGIHP
jgi:DNA modification methylase